MSAGVKYDTGKSPWELLPYEAIDEVLKVLLHGANKYPEADNWKRVPEGRRRYFSAGMRHRVAWWLGEKLDPETEHNHLAHSICCDLFLLWKDLKGVDDLVDDSENKKVV